MATRRQCRNRINKRPLSERSEFRTLPDFGAGGVCTPRSGAPSSGSPFLAYVFWRSKRGRSAAGPKPGLPVRQGTLLVSPASKKSNVALRLQTSKTTTHDRLGGPPSIRPSAYSGQASIHSLREHSGRTGMRAGRKIYGNGNGHSTGTGPNRSTGNHPPTGHHSLPPNHLHPHGMLPAHRAQEPSPRHRSRRASHTQQKSDDTPWDSSAYSEKRTRKPRQATSNRRVPARPQPQPQQPPTPNNSANALTALPTPPKKSTPSSPRCRPNSSPPIC